jgi:hypothetical protein
MNKETVSAAISSLRKLGLIEARISPGARSFYHIRSIPELLNCPLIPDSQKEILHQGKTQLSGNDAQQLSGNKGEKVTPSKVTSGHSFRDDPDKRIFCRIPKSLTTSKEGEFKMNRMEDSIASIAENAGGVAAICEADLGRRVVYTTRARIMLDAIRGVFVAMDQIEHEATTSDFDDAWRALRLRLSYSQTQLQQILNGVAGITQPPCHPATGRGNN